MSLPFQPPTVQPPSPTPPGQQAPVQMRALPLLNVLMPGMDGGRARSRTLDITAMAGGDITRDLSKGSLLRRAAGSGSSPFMRKASTPAVRNRRQPVGSSAEDFRFNLFSAKESALDKLRSHSHSHPGSDGPGHQQPAFQRFYESDACNHFLLASLFYFGSFIRLERMEKLFAAPRKGQALGKDIRARRDLLRAKIDVLQCQRELGSSYAMVLVDSLQHRSDSSVQADVGVPSLWARLASNEESEMFETVLDFACHFLKLVFDAKYYNRIDAEISTMFRSEYFSSFSSHRPSTITSEAKSKRTMPSLRTLAVLKYGQSHSNRAHTADFTEKAAARLSGSEKKSGSQSQANEILKTGVRPGRRVRTIHGAIRMRSPLIASLFPSADDKFQLQKLERMERAATAEANRIQALAKGESTTGHGHMQSGAPPSPRGRPEDGMSLSTSVSGNANAGTGEYEMGVIGSSGEDELHNDPANVTGTAVKQGVAAALKTITPSLSIPLPFHDVLVKSDHWQSIRDHEKASLRAMSIAGQQHMPQGQGQGQPLSQPGNTSPAPMSIGERLQVQKQFVGRRFSMLGPQILPQPPRQRSYSPQPSPVSRDADSPDAESMAGSDGSVNSREGSRSASITHVHTQPHMIGGSSGGYNMNVNMTSSGSGYDRFSPTVGDVSGNVNVASNDGFLAYRVHSMSSAGSLK